MIATQVFNCEFNLMKQTGKKTSKLFASISKKKIVFNINCNLL
jgi:hypothetical protein